MNKSTFFFGGVYLLSFVCLLLNLNYNIKTFSLTQELQTVNLELQEIEREVDLMALDYYTKTTLDKVYRVATEKLDMKRQDEILVFTNKKIKTR